MAVSTVQSSRAILKLWWADPRRLLLVLLMTCLGLVDSIFTSLWVDRQGIHGEMNPFARWLLGSELSMVWLVVNVTVSFMSGVVLTSSTCMLEGNRRRSVAWFFSMLLAIKMTLAGLHTIYYFNIEALAPVVLFLSAIILFSSRNILLGGNIFLDIAHTFSNLWTDLLWTFSATRSAFASIRTNAGDTRSDAGLDRRMSGGTRRGKRLLFWITLIIVVPIVALTVMELITQLSGVQSLPRWLRSLGIVTALQGQMLLVSFVIVILTMAILLYAFLTVFEILSDSGRRRRSE